MLCNDEAAFLLLQKEVKNNETAINLKHLELTEAKVSFVLG